jgi:hypothetical protein
MFGFLSQRNFPKFLILIFGSTAFISQPGNYSEINKQDEPKPAPKSRKELGLKKGNFKFNSCMSLFVI